MRKITIVEIENSFLNLFTPAVIVAIGYFLFNLFAWPLLFFEWLIEGNNFQYNSQILQSVVYTVAIILVSLMVYFIIIPKLKVKNIEYREPTFNGFILIFFLFTITIFSQFLLELLFVILNIGKDWAPMSNPEFDDFLTQILSSILISISTVIYIELIYRRTVIPLLEDRGVSSIHAVILSSLGYSLTFLPTFLMYPNISGFIYNFSSLTILGIFGGIAFITTRNILYPVILGILLRLFTDFRQIGLSFEDQFLIVLSDFIIVFSILLSIGILVYILWKNKVKKTSLETFNEIKVRSVPGIRRGMIGFFIISISLFILQTIVVKIGREVTHNIFPEYFLFITPFYLIVFSLPFFLTISTEYAQD